MKIKNKSKFISVLLIFLLTSVGIVIILFNNRLSRDIRAAKEFITLLYDKKIVDTSQDKEKIKYEVVKLAEGDKEYYRVTSQNYGIDLDSNYKVIGFNYNYKVTSSNGIAISSEEARAMAEEYISYLVSGDYKYKSIIEESKDENLSYYGYIFTRYKDGYPFYSDQIMIQIDKYSGYLTGYSNSTSQGEPKKVKKNIEIATAEETALNAFNKLNNKGEIHHEETYPAFCDNKDKTETELCYVVSVNGIDMNGKEVKWKYFVSINTGKIINSLKDTVSKTIA